MSIPNWSTTYAASSVGERHVLGRQRIDRGRPDEGLSQRDLVRHVLLAVEDRCVVALERGPQEVDHVAVRRRQIDVTAPDPTRLRLGEVVDHRRGLRVVDDHEVVVVLEFLRVLGVVAAEDLLLGLGQATLVALERVVDRLRDAEELVGALDDPPLDVEPRIDHQRDQRVVDLGHAAAERGRREMHDALAAQRLGETVDLLHQAARRQRRIVGEGLVSGVDELEHQRGVPEGAYTQDNQENRLVAEELDKAEPGAAAFGTLTGLELVCDGP